MGSSTITLQNVVDAIASMGNVSPLANPGSYATDTLLAIANDVMGDLISRRFNWKWNSKLGPKFLTNAWQQDYPLAGIKDLGWLEQVWWLDINSTARPIPVSGRDEFTPARGLDIESSRWSAAPNRIAWDYNDQLQTAAWPGPGVTYAPQIGQGVTPENPFQSIQDASGNILTLLQPGKTGLVAPNAGSGAAEGMTFNDGTCSWMVCAPRSQGFRISPLPPANRVYEIHTKYQRQAQPFTSIDQTIDPLPDDYAHHFRRGFKDCSHAYSPDASLRAQWPSLRSEWLSSMVDAEKEADREPDNYMLAPATGVMASTYPCLRNPLDPSRPY